MLHPPGDWARGFSSLIFIVHTCHKVLHCYKRHRDILSHVAEHGEIGMLYWIMSPVSWYEVIGSVCSQQDAVDIYWNLNIMY